MSDHELSSSIISFSGQGLSDHLSFLVEARKGSDSSDNVESTASVLEQLATELRQETYRETVDCSKVARCLCEIMHAAIDPVLRDNSASWVNLVMQVGRVAANLCADNDTNREQLLAVSYPELTLKFFVVSPDTNTIYLKTLVASLLNLCVQHYVPASTCLAQAPNLERLFGVIEVEEIAQWVWQILAVVIEDDDSVTLDFAARLDAIIQPLEIFLPQLVPPSDLESDHEAEMAVLSSVTRIIELLGESEQVEMISYFLPPVTSRQIPLLLFLLNWIEKAEPPSNWQLHRGGKDDQADTVNPAIDGDDDSFTYDDVDKAIGSGKACLVRAVCGLSSNIGLEDIRLGWFWETMRTWLQVAERDDLVGCGLLCFGNAARSDSACISLLDGDRSLLPIIMSLLSSSTPVIVQHALSGVLRNLSIPPPNKVILGDAGVLEALINMGVWSEQRDLASSVGQGALETVKHLCRNNDANAKRFVHHPNAIDQLLALSARTDDQRIKLESVRVFVNAIRSIASSQSNEGMSRLSDQRIIDSLAELLAAGEKYPTLLNEAIVSLALLATYGSKGTDLAIIRSVYQGFSAEKTPAWISLHKVVFGVAPLSEEIQANGETLLKQLVKGKGVEVDALKHALEDEVAAMKSSGRTSIPDVLHLEQR